MYLLILEKEFCQALERLRQVDLCEFKACMVYIMNSRLAITTV